MDESARPEDAAGRASPPERVVVGVDGSMGSLAALRWAAAAAARRQAPLYVVTAWHYPAGAALAPRAGLRDMLQASAESTAQAAADDVAMDGELNDLEVHAEAIEGPVGQALVSAAAGASLLVVGNRRRSEIGSLLLGSVSQYCVTHPPCPVVVVPLPVPPPARPHVDTGWSSRQQPARIGPLF